MTPVVDEQLSEHWDVSVEGHGGRRMLNFLVASVIVFLRSMVESVGCLVVKTLVLCLREVRVSSLDGASSPPQRVSVRPWRLWG